VNISVYILVSVHIAVGFVIKHSVKNSLMVYQCVRTDECPYSCGVGNKTFRNLRNMKVHQCVHNGEHPYGCGLCNKTFSKISNLNKHQHLHAVYIHVYCP
jgi:KRAB domain-containing zinc finger protein